MRYDFVTKHSRKGVGSNKWDQMYRRNPSIPDDVVPLSVADMEFANPPQIAEGLYRYMKEMIFGYTSPTASYYEAVVNWMKRRHQWEIKKEWIVDYPGVVPALYDLVKLLTKPGEGVILMTPVYYPFYSAIKNGGRDLIESRLKINGNRYEIDFDDFEKKASTPKNTLFILCNPHNPVGRVWTREELTRIGRICIDNNVLIISDEIHHDLIMPGYEHTAFASISEEFAGHSISCTAPSKTFNMAGLATSNIIIPDPDLKERVCQYRESQGRFFCNIAGYKACEIVYNECEDWLEELLTVIDRNRKFLKDYLNEKLPMIKVFELEGTYLQWLDCRGMGMDCHELEHFMEDEAYVITDEGYVFGEPGEGFERINLACPASIIRETLERLYQAYQKR